MPSGGIEELSVVLRQPFVITAPGIAPPPDQPGGYTPEELTRLYTELRTRLEAIPGVMSVSNEKRFIATGGQIPDSRFTLSIEPSDRPEVKVASAIADVRQAVAGTLKSVPNQTIALLEPKNRLERRRSLKTDQGNAVLLTEN